MEAETEMQAKTETRRGPAAAEISRTQWRSPASSGEGTVFSRLWAPQKPAAVVQIAHGMSEYSARYDAFAAFLAENGFAVGMNDHAGHGESALTKGYFAQKDGWECVLRDMKRLEDELREKYPGAPVFLMGHSMGSFLARSYITRYRGLSGCILSGTAGRNPALGLGRLLAAVQKRVLGPKSQGRLLAKLSFGGYLGRIQNPVNGFAWLSTVDEVPRVYAQDEFCGFPFTAGGYADLFGGVAEISGSGWAARVPAQLPVYLFSGAEDPVGAYGKGPREVYDALKASGHGDVQLKLYPGARHEVLNEACREQAYEDIRQWLAARLPAREGAPA